MIVDISVAIKHQTILTDLLSQSSWNVMIENDMDIMCSCEDNDALSHMQPFDYIIDHTLHLIFT